MKAYKKILVPSDLSESCAIAAHQARQLASVFDSEVLVLHVVDYLPPAYMSAEIPAEFSSKELLIARATETLEKWAVENGLQDCKTLVEIGRPKKVIVTQIKEQEVDLVVMAPYHRDGIALFFGSVANAVAQATDVDVLIARQ